MYGLNPSIMKLLKTIRPDDSFWKGQGHQGISSLVKGNLWGNCKFLLEHFKGAKAMTMGHGGNSLNCLLEVSGMYNWMGKIFILTLVKNDEWFALFVHWVELGLFYIYFSLSLPKFTAFHDKSTLILLSIY